MQRLPVQMMCWILPGTSMDLNLAGKSAALWGMCKSPNAKTNTIFNVRLSNPYQNYLLADQTNKLTSNSSTSFQVSFRKTKLKMLIEIIYTNKKIA